QDRQAFGRPGHDSVQGCKRHSRRFLIWNLNMSMNGVGIPPWGRARAIALMMPHAAAYAQVAIAPVSISFSQDIPPGTSRPGRRPRVLVSPACWKDLMRLARGTILPS